MPIVIIQAPPGLRPEKGRQMVAYGKLGRVAGRPGFGRTGKGFGCLGIRFDTCRVDMHAQFKNYFIKVVFQAPDQCDHVVVRSNHSYEGVIGRSMSDGWAVVTGASSGKVS